MTDEERRILTNCEMEYFRNLLKRPTHLNKPTIQVNRRKYNKPSASFEDILSRLLSEVVKNAISGCWEWTGYKDRNGYGHVSVAGKAVLTHRLSYELYHGQIPEGMEVRHYICDNPPCCNPEHLKLGTHTENMRDKIKQLKPKINFFEGDNA